VPTNTIYDLCNASGVTMSVRLRCAGVSTTRASGSCGLVARMARDQMSCADGLEGNSDTVSVSACRGRPVGILYPPRV
jgi:hypothetical protein